MYRTLFFLPDPALCDRIPVAVLTLQDGKLRYAVALRLPDTTRLGGPRRAAVLRAGLGRLADAEDIEGPRFGIGPHFVWGETRPVDANVDDFHQWAQSRVFPAGTQMEEL